MAFSGYEIDDEYADDGFVKIYIDFDKPEECERFAEWAEDNWHRVFQPAIDEFENGGRR